MTTENVQGVITKVLVGVATAATLALASSTIKATEVNAVQNVRLDRIETVVNRMESLERALIETKNETALLRKELEKRER